MTYFIDLEKEPDDSQLIFVILPVAWATYQLMHDVKLEIILLTINLMLCWSMHVQMVNLIDIWANSIQVSQLNCAHILLRLEL